MVLGKLPVPGRPSVLITVGQGLIALAVGAGGVVLTFLLSSVLSSLPPSLWETARCRLKYCLKGPLNPKQPTNSNSYKKKIKIYQAPKMNQLNHSIYNYRMVYWATQLITVINNFDKILDKGG